MLDLGDILRHGSPSTPDGEPGDDGTCGDCADGKCHGTDPDDCECARHDASVEAGAGALPPALVPVRHPMEYADDAQPISSAAMRARVAEVVGDNAAQILDEMSYWALRCAEVKLAGGDPEGSDKAMWMYAVLREADDDPYADVRPPDGECYCGGCIGTGRCDDDLGQTDDDWDDLYEDDDDDGVIWIPSIEIVHLPEQDVT